MKTMTRSFATAAALLAGLSFAASATAQEVTLKVHHFLSPKAPAHTKLAMPWAEAVEEQSGGRIKVEVYPAMQLGGKPPQLIDQVRDGIVDVVWTLPGYTAGRYPVISAFELPFMVTNAEATSQAVQEYYEKNAKAEFGDVHPLFFHVHARGSFHTREAPIKSVADFDGLKLRAPNRLIGASLDALGASPIFMPAPALPEALSKGVVDGTVFPWEVVLPLKIFELAPNHAEMTSPRGMYTSVFIFAMNKAKYDGLPDDLKKVIDDNSGMALAQRMGAVWDQVEVPGENKSRERGNTVVELSDSEVAKIQEITRPVVDKWIADLTDAGHDGQALYDEANGLIEKYSQ